MSGAKIVGIHGVTSTKGGGAKPLPVVVTKLRDAMKQRVSGLLRKLFESADDALFAMADKAGTNGDQAHYFDAMRELRLQRKHIATEVIKGVIQSFNEMGSYQSSIQSEKNASALDELALVQNDDLELKVAIESMSSRVRSASGANLEEIRLRCESLVAPLTLKPEQVPVGPEILSEHFVKGAEKLDVSIRAKLVLLKLFEKYVLTEMLTVYAEANQLLMKSGILPDLKANQAVKRPASRPTQSTQKNDAFNQEVLAEDERVGNADDLVPTLQVAYTGQGDGESIGLADIHSLLHPNRSASSEPPVLNLSHYEKRDLVNTLSGFQAEQIIDAQNRETCQVIDFRSILNTRLAKEQSVSATFSEMDDDVINLVSMLFEFILDDPQLQPIMKALISRLQIPILKVALMDRTFFSKGGHPARKLLNLIASSAIGWTEAPNGRTDHLRNKIEYVVDTVLKQFDDRVELFAELLEDFSAFTDKENRRGLLIERRIKDSEQGKAANEVARQRVQDMLNGAMKNRTIPDCVLELLRDGWSNLMVLHYLKDGDESTDWQQDCELVGDLIWTVSPSNEEGDARSKLLRKIPGVIKRLRDGLKEAGFDEFRTKALLQDLEKEHVKTLGSLQAVNDVVTETVEPKALPEDAQPDNEHLADTVAEQNEAIEELVRSTMELEEDFKRMQAMKAAEIRETGEDGEDTTSNTVEGEVDPSSESTLQDNDNDQELEHEEIVLVAKDEPLPSEVAIDDNDPFVQQVDTFAVGCWFEFDDQGRSERCKLAAVIKATGKYIFVNRSGVKVAEKTRMGLAVELRRGSVRILNDGLLFDRALESVITSLRSKTK